MTPPDQTPYSSATAREFHPLKEGECRAQSVRQRERQYLISPPGAELGMAAGRDQHVLLAVPHIGHPRCLAAGGETSAPQLGTAPGVERAQVVVHRGADEDKTSRGHDRSAEIGRAG